MADIVPELMSSIETAFQTYSMTDRKLARISQRIRDGTATQIDGHAYAERLGINASKALQDVLTEENLPDGKLYYNIATRTVIPTLENNQALINDAASTIQKRIDVKNKLYLNTIQPKFPKERVYGLIEKMTADDITLDQARAWIKEPIVNNSEAFFDDFIRENATFRRDSGMKVTITRIADANCCKWCADLEGTYEYAYDDTIPADIYRRHEFCRCSVTVTSKRDRSTENVWTKKQWQSNQEELERRENTVPRQMTKAERAETLSRLEKDKVVKQIMDATGYSRDTANYIAGQSPEKIRKEIANGRRNR